jgi:hypothetical protein
MPNKTNSHTLISPANNAVFGRGRCCPKIKKKVKEGFKLDFFRVGAIGGKLILNPSLF